MGSCRSVREAKDQSKKGETALVLFPYPVNLVHPVRPLYAFSVALSIRVHLRSFAAPILRALCVFAVNLA